MGKQVSHKRFIRMVDAALKRAIRQALRDARRTGRRKLAPIDVRSAVLQARAF